MDGQTIQDDPKTAEYMRQREIFDRCMTELERDKRKREAMGYAMIAGVYAFEPASRGEGLLGRATTFSKYALIAAAGIIPNLLVISILLN